MKKRIVIGSDHGAVELKSRIIRHLEERGDEVRDMGVFNQESVDYPDIVRDTVREFRKKEYSCGIICCGTGIGVSMSANKYHGIRCALPQDSYAAEMAKLHNNANFIAFGGRVSYKDTIESMLDAFLNTEFEGGRHASRVQKMMDQEE